MYSSFWVNPTYWVNCPDIHKSRNAIYNDRSKNKKYCILVNSVPYQIKSFMNFRMDWVWVEKALLMCLMMTILFLWFEWKFRELLYKKNCIILSTYFENKWVLYLLFVLNCLLQIEPACNDIRICCSLVPLRIMILLFINLSPETHQAHFWIGAWLLHLSGRLLALPYSNLFRELVRSKHHNDTIHKSTINLQKTLFFTIRIADFPWWTD